MLLALGAFGTFRLILERVIYNDRNFLRREIDTKDKKYRCIFRPISILISDRIILTQSKVESQLSHNAQVVSPSQVNIHHL